MPKNAQVSQEYFYLFVFIVFLISGSIFVLQKYTSDYQEEFAQKRAKNILEKIVDNSDKISSFAIGSRIGIDLNFPEGIRNFTIFHNSGTCTKCTELRIKTAYQQDSWITASSSTMINSTAGSYSCGTDSCALTFPKDYYTQGKKSFQLTNHPYKIDIVKK